MLDGDDRASPGAVERWDGAHPQSSAHEAHLHAVITWIDASVAGVDVADARRAAGRRRRRTPRMGPAAIRGTRIAYQAAPAGGRSAVAAGLCHAARLIDHTMLDAEKLGLDPREYPAVRQAGAI